MRRGLACCASALLGLCWTLGCPRGATTEPVGPHETTATNGVAGTASSSASGSSPIAIPYLSQLVHEAIASSNCKPDTATVHVIPKRRAAYVVCAEPDDEPRLLLVSGDGDVENAPDWDWHDGVFFRERVDTDMNGGVSLTVQILGSNGEVGPVLAWDLKGDVWQRR